VRFIELMPLGNRDRLRAEQCIQSDQVRSVIEREFGGLAPFTRSGSAGPSDNYQISGARGVIGFISPISKHFCGTCRRLRLTADGKIRPCLLSDTEIDIKSPMRAGCADAELERQLRLALEIKPDRHHVTKSFGGCFERTMSRIGG
jgi:cyclic pyranopterin phosphate synthase